MHLTPQVTDDGTIFSPQRHGEHRGNFIFARSASGSESLRLGEETTIGQKNQPFGHDPVARWFYADGWRHAIELSPKAEALFPGRRLPAREKISLLGGLCVSVVNPRSRFLRPSSCGVKYIGVLNNSLICCMVKDSQGMYYQED
jgi:hypothetical protein